MDCTWYYESPLGALTLTSDGEALFGIEFGRTGHCSGPAHLFEDACRWLDIYFSGKEPGFTPKLALQGLSPFRRRVCEIMLTIPFGKTMSYGEIAAIIAREKGLKRMSAQAVGGAVGHNPIPIIIPCHRVVGSDGSLTGYSAGLDKKVFLLQLERQSPLLRAAHHKRHQALA